MGGNYVCVFSSLYSDQFSKSLKTVITIHSSFETQWQVFLMYYLQPNSLVLGPSQSHMIVCLQALYRRAHFLLQPNHKDITPICDIQVSTSLQWSIAFFLQFLPFQVDYQVIMVYPGDQSTRIIESQQTQNTLGKTNYSFMIHIGTQ